ncbi:DUF4365 domain-containing protein [Natronolimnobius sp. AArcel1]|uniref:DUF4365 domain-containing protein n=1 Tax=Natronolimnobius sp. AArcel1 TaxID=1679093 RepID=UPI0013ED94BA|nr:DUF4365 domain-containing protein [Natronolimnobius sp. AArcel1]NGM71385.1 DUF4365 domain-containing protein [Natronolimnobius sp. AArcel1]
MGKRKDSNHVLEEQSKGKVRTELAQWVVNALDDEDYAFDYEIRPVGEFVDSGIVDPSPFYAQLKASRWFDDEDDIWWDFNTEYLLEDCLQASVPVVLLVYERYGDTLHWCVIQEHCWDVLDEERPGWQEQSSVRIRFERDPITDVKGRNHLRTAIERTQRRISTREYIATSQRETFSHSQGTTLASSEEVLDHKHKLIGEAKSFIEANQTARALQKLMDVYQLPEVDDPTLEAIKHLIALRETTDVSVALSKIRFASKGLQLAEEYNRAELRESLEDELTNAQEYVSERFVGAKYDHTNAKRELLVLTIEDWGISDAGADIIAQIQWGNGELDTEMAHAIAGDDCIKLKQSGESRTPQGIACAEREHRFETDMLAELPCLAKCTVCGLSCETLEDVLEQEIPAVCDECGSLGYDITWQRDTKYCPDCRGSSS